MGNIRAGTLSPRPYMDLIFKVQRARATQATPVGRNMSLTETWVLNPRSIPCDIMPIADQVYFLQAGQDNIATHTLHFYAGTDIRPKDKVKVLSSVRLAGPIGSWFNIEARIEPTESIAFVRCYARISDSPKL